MKPLLIDLVPRPLWGLNLRNAIPGSQWRRLRQWALDRADDSCEVCGLHVDGGKNLVCHELWSYDDDRNLQTLTGVEVHCRPCDAVTHIGRVGAVAGAVAAMTTLRHLTVVNGWTGQQALQHYTEAKALFVARSQRQWEQDTSWFDRWAAEHDD